MQVQSQLHVTVCQHSFVLSGTACSDNVTLEQNKSGALNFPAERYDCNPVVVEGLDELSFHR
jgi:hypothetical protein